MKRSVSGASLLLFIVVALSGSAAAQSKDRGHPAPVILLAILASPLSNEVISLHPILGVRLDCTF